MLNPFIKAAVAIVATALLFCIVSADLRSNLRTSYAGDSFWTLAFWSRAGVLAISTAGIAAIFAMTYKMRFWFLEYAQRTAILLHITCAWLLFLTIFAASPQVFYSFYQLIFPDLPAQWVVSLSQFQARLMPILDLRTSVSLADDAATLVLWALIPFVIWLRD